MALQDDDNLIIGRGSTSYKISYQELKDDIGAGGGGGGTSVDYPPGKLPGGSLTLTPTNFSSNNNLLEFSGDGITWTLTYSSSIGEVVQVRWVETAFDDAEHDSTVESILTYDIQGGPTYNETYRYNVDKLPSDFTLDAEIDTLPAAPAECPSEVNVTDINARVRIWATTTDASTPQVYIDGAWEDVASTPDDSVLIDPDTQIKVRHTTSPTILEESSSTWFIGWDGSANATATFNTTNVDAGVVQPTITNITDGEVDVLLGLTFLSSEFVGIGPIDTHVSTDWQLATDSAFTNIAHQSMGDTSNLTSWSPNYAHDTEFWLRVRYNGSDPSVTSDWSPVINFTTIDAYIEKPTITSPTAGSTVDINGVSIVASAINGIAYGTHASSDWQVASDDTFSTIISESIADTQDLTSWTSGVTNLSNRTLYLRVRYNGSEPGVVSAYSDTVEVSGEELYYFQLQVITKGGSGKRSQRNNQDTRAGGAGGQGDLTFETTVGGMTPPGTLKTMSQYGTGGGGSGGGVQNGNDGAGGHSSAVFLNGTIVAVAGGGGGGMSAGDPAGLPGTALETNGNPNPNNGNVAGGALSAGTGAGGQVFPNAKPCPGGGGYGRSVGYTNGGWKLVSAVAGTAPNLSMQNANSDNSGKHDIFLRRKKGPTGNWEEIGSAINNYDGPISGVNAFTAAQAEVEERLTEEFNRSLSQIFPIDDDVPQLQELVEEARERLAALELNEVSDDAVDTALITLIGNINDRLTALEGGN